MKPISKMKEKHASTMSILARKARKLKIWRSQLSWRRILCYSVANTAAGNIQRMAVSGNRRNGWRLSVAASMAKAALTAQSALKKRIGGSWRRQRRRKRHQWLAVAASVMAE
jgi:hypothetical protein